MKKLLVIVDMQNGFINEHTKHLVEKMKSFLDIAKFDDIVATRYINNTETACYKFEGWKECMPGTPEIEIADELKPYIHKVFDKNVYSCWNTVFKAYVKSNRFDKVYFVGVNTGCCVLHSIFDCYNDVQDCAVISDLCGSSTSQESHECALRILRECITKERVITTEQFIESKNS